MDSIDRSFRRRAAAACACALLALVSSIARGQGADAISLREAVRIAREQNPDLVAARLGVETAHAQDRIAGEVPNPSLTATTNKIPTDGTPARTSAGDRLFDRAYDSSVALAQQVEVGGKRRSRQDSAREAIRGAQARLADTDRLVVANVVRNYAAAALAREVAQIDRRSAESFGKTARLAAEREESGEISHSDRVQIEIAASRSAADAEAAEISSTNAARSLAAVLALPPETAGAFPDGLDALLEAVPSVFEEGDESRVLESRPDLVALEAGVRKAEADLALARAFRYSDPTLLAQYERQPPDQRNTVGVGVSFPVPLFHRNDGAIDAAGVALSVARLDLDALRLRVRSELLTTRNILRAAETRAARYRGDLVPRAESVREIVEFSYAQGGASFLELLEAERNANDIRLAAAAAAADVVASRADYLAARGIFFAEGGRS